MWFRAAKCAANIAIALLVAAPFAASRAEANTPAPEPEPFAIVPTTDGAYDDFIFLDWAGLNATGYHYGAYGTSRMTRYEFAFVTLKMLEDLEQKAGSNPVQPFRYGDRTMAVRKLRRLAHKFANELVMLGWSPTTIDSRLGRLSSFIQSSVELPGKLQPPHGRWPDRTKRLWPEWSDPVDLPPDVCEGPPRLPRFFWRRWSPPAFKLGLALSEPDP
jgi:hypothetical protein